MTVLIDDLPLEVPEDATVSAVLQLLGEALKHVIVEVNGSLVRSVDYESKRLKPGDRVEVIYPAFGG